MSLVHYADKYFAENISLLIKILHFGVSNVSRATEIIHEVVNTYKLSGLWRERGRAFV